MPIGRQGHRVAQRQRAETGGLDAAMRYKACHDHAADTALNQCRMQRRVFERVAVLKEAARCCLWTTRSSTRG
jgi:hypothetical protein